MNEGVWKNVVIPTLVNGSAFIGITTLGEDGNFVHELVKIKKKNGRNLFNVVRIEMICTACKRKGLREECPHKKGEMPPWHDPSRHEDVRQMLGQDPDTYAREIL